MYNRTEKIVMWLSTFEFMSYKKAKFLVDNFDLDTLFDNIEDFSSDLLKCFSKPELTELVRNRNLSYIEKVIKNYDELGITIVTIRSNAYPELLKEIDSSPIILYCKGDINLLKTDCLGVVGTRRATKYGKDLGNKFVKDIASEGITIVSGLAEGIDTVAHKSTLEVGGKTIAVLGGGLLNLYPSSNISLAEEIVKKGGLLVSEYKPSEQALSYHFPIRNRIIAGLSKAILIVEATEKSGSMHTKNYALDYNREVFAMPARINDIYSIGCNKCIQNGQARMVLHQQEIIEFFGKKVQDNTEEKHIQLTCEEQLIYDTLLGHEKHFDEIKKDTGLEVKVLQTLLMRLALKGIVNKLPGNYYSL
ncbi:MAG: DNA-processing protein DprA [Christensenellales bacterium]